MPSSLVCNGTDLWRLFVCNVINPVSIIGPLLINLFFSVLWFMWRCWDLLFLLISSIIVFLFETNKQNQSNNYVAYHFCIYHGYSCFFIAHLQLIHGYDAVAVWINDFLKLLLPLSDPLIFDLCSLLVLHSAHGQRNELRQCQPLIAVLVWKKNPRIIWRTV